MGRYLIEAAMFSIPLKKNLENYQIILPVLKTIGTVGNWIAQSIKNKEMKDELQETTTEYLFRIASA